ncbi:MAG: TIGR03084 family protein [Dehalococcoidia bacterium]|nr:TIGR03084 family protein [Dehalococcoidia bacterium]
MASHTQSDQAASGPSGDDSFQALIDDLAAEAAYLDAAVRDVSPARWEVASPAAGWLMRDCIAHLAELDEVAAIIAEAGAYPVRSREGSAGVLSAGQVKARALPVADLLAWWRASRARLEAALRPLDPRARLPWAGQEMGVRSFATARLMECWSHGLDALEAAGVEAVDSDRLRHVAHLGYSTRPFAYRVRGLPVSDAPLHVALQAPSGATWTWGPEDAPSRVTGTAGDFCRVVTQRIHHLDTALIAEGEAAREFLVIAQAFAGPPGEGRAPRGDGHR